MTLIEPEEILTGGNVSGAVVRVGATVRKLGTPATPAVEALLGYLNAAGFAAAPRTLGRDERGRHVLEYIPGRLADTLGPLDPAGLHRVGQIIRDLHDTAAGFRPPPGARWNVVIPPDRRDLICHHDLSPWNLVCDSDRWVFIDWDLAGPGSRRWDLAGAAASFVPLAAGGDPAADYIDGHLAEWSRALSRQARPLSRQARLSARPPPGPSAGPRRCQDHRAGARMCIVPAKTGKGR